VRLLDDVVAIDWIGRSRTIRYAEIEAVRVTDVKGVKSIDPETTGGVATVTISAVDGRSVQLTNFKDGSLSLYRALDDAHRRGGPPR
jgi:hypothetical protein